MKKQKGPFVDEVGQTLVEILFAFSVAILVLSAIITGITTSLNNTQYTKNQNLANSYAQEGMSVVRQIKDNDWPDFKTKEDFCLGQDLASISPPCAENVGIFIREVKIAHDSSDCSNGSINGSKVTVKVSWSDSKCGIGNSFCHKVELISCFSNASL